MDDRAFLDEILAAPGDDTPRLIWADWLEEQGDPRADFIRAQCAAAQLPLWDVGRQILEYQAACLWAEYGGTWTAALPEAPGARWGAFERGMPCRVLIQNFPEFVAQGVDVVRTTAPRPQYRFREGAGLPASMDPCDWLREASSLHLPALRDEVAATVIRQCVPWRLESLTLEPIPGRGRAIHPWLAAALGAARPRELTLVSTDASGVELPILDHVMFLQRLRFRAGMCVHLKDVANHVGLEALEQFSTSDTAMPARAFEFIATGRAFQRLRSLRLTSSAPQGVFQPNLMIGAVPSGIEWMTAAHRLPDLVDLKLENAQLGDDGLTLVAGAPGFKNLRSLSLAQNQFTPIGVAALAASPLVGQLEGLDLSKNALGALGIQVLAKSPHLGKLRLLNLRSTCHDERALLDLADKLPPECELWVEGNGLPEATLDALERRNR